MNRLPHLLLLLTLVAPLATAQPVAFGVDGGLGLGLASQPGVGYSGRAAAWAARGPWTLTARQTVASGGTDGSQDAFGFFQRDVYLDQSLLVGRAVQRGAARITLSAGPAITYGDLAGDCDADGCEAGFNTGPDLGLALEAMARRSLASHLGGHIGAFATVGAGQPYGGLVAGLSLSTR